MAIISVKNLVKTYIMGDVDPVRNSFPWGLLWKTKAGISNGVEVHALRGVSVDITPGDFVAIMGASGSGKTTFMNIVGCLDVATKGEYYLDSVDVKTLNRDRLASLRNKKIGFVFQSFNLLSRTTAMENVELPLLYTNSLTASQIQEKAMSALSAVGMADRKHHFPNQLSGGQQQRVAIARSLVNDPVVILADEPTGNLDTRTSVEVMSILQKLNKSGMTIVLVTHEQDIASYARRHIIFRDGKIIKIEEFQDVKDAGEQLKKMPAPEAVEETM